MKIPITKPLFGQEELDIIQKPLESGWVVQGPYVKEFEDKFSNFTNISYSVATSSCTTALHIAVAALDLKPGDEVIVPAFTWVATANVVEYMGATPKFCDIDIKTYNIDVSKIEELITPNTVGIIPVHLFGLSADMDPIVEIAKTHNLWVVEDAACGLGAYYKGQHVGGFGEMGCFSFHPRKSITTGEGGMITTDMENLDILSRSLRDHGASKTDLDRHQSKQGFLLADYNLLGYNFRMTDIQGALGTVQMDRAEEVLQARKKLAQAYDEILADIEWLDSPEVPEGYEHGYQSYVCMYRPEKPMLVNINQLFEQRNALMARLEDQGIATRQGTHAVVTQRWYVNKYKLQPDSFPNAYFAEKLSLSLPLYPQMTSIEFEYVINGIQSGK
ncbi:DegT/DnrJ/EryC1/StrS family aminotransferase [Chloroflexota bacterium]